MGWHAPKCDAEYEAMLGVDLSGTAPAVPHRPPMRTMSRAILRRTGRRGTSFAPHEAAYWRPAKIDERRGK
jgi:hypothetical protein